MNNNNPCNNPYNCANKLRAKLKLALDSAKNSLQNVKQTRFLTPQNKLNPLRAIGLTRNLRHTGPY